MSSQSRNGDCKAYNFTLFHSAINFSPIMAAKLCLYYNYIYVYCCSVDSRARFSN